MFSDGIQKIKNSFSSSFCPSSVCICADLLEAEGIKKILSVSESSVKLLSDNKKIIINGEKLMLNELSSDYVCVKGKILSVEFE